MGAVAALMYAAKHEKKITAIISDSAFCSIKGLVNGIVKKHMKILPNFIRDYLFENVKNEI